MALNSNPNPTARDAAIEAALAVDGWLTAREAQALFDLAREAKAPIVEIGSWRGRSTVALGLGSVAGGRQPIFAIDPFTGALPHARPTAFGTPANSGCCEALLRANLDKAGVNGQVRIIAKTSAEAAAEIPDCAVLFIDGAHDYPSISADLAAYLPKVIPGGSVIVHDVAPSDPGVVKAVDEHLTANFRGWRAAGRVDSALIFRKSATVRHNVALALPGRSWEFSPMMAICKASRLHGLAMDNNGNGFDDFNICWARALNAFERGQITHFAMLHSDVIPDDYWLDILLGEMDDLGADLVSTAIPLKDNKGLTSCGIGDRDNPWGAFRRFTVRDLLDMPQTFSIADTPHPERFLLHNTGCFVCDLRQPLFRATNADGTLKCWFDFPTRMARGADGLWACDRESEDWFFSRQIAALGARTFITRKVRLLHWGNRGFPNDEPWGTYKNGDEESRHKWEPEIARA